ncbi:MAG: hypothetical protein PHO20_04375 [Candidatus Peribacteraceae bacterium]|jgi:hypothetical protein|nr:hypothetical protein [Candidatus Peribacteraceae bacterium]MDD5739976.1 hypothetical protein [Candidatus Peribacteraceae bacterium]
MALSASLSRKFLGLSTLSLGGLSLLIVGYAFFGFNDASAPLEGRLVPAAYHKEVQWRVINTNMVESGATIPPDTNVIFLLPGDASAILRRILLGSYDPDIRYWGYCLPEDYDQTRAVTSDRLPGKVFLSEGERKARDEEYRRQISNRFSIPENLTDEDLNQLRTRPAGRIEHEIETFDPSSICYIMSQVPLAIGLDPDDDEANDQVEKEYGTDPKVADTDGDGVSDGREIFFLHSSPIRRDSDGDGLIDGVEDANHNGHIDATETDPVKWDTDRDGLPDGLMKIGVRRDTQMMGEDKNLNGIVDDGETDPRKWSSLGDDISDGDRYYQCLMTGGTDC